MASEEEGRLSNNNNTHECHGNPHAAARTEHLPTQRPGQQRHQHRIAVHDCDLRSMQKCAGFFICDGRQRSRLASCVKLLHVFNGNL